MEKTRGFKPAIHEFFLLTTASDDAKIQEVARTITDERTQKTKITFFEIRYVISDDFFATAFSDQNQFIFRMKMPGRLIMRNRSDSNKSDHARWSLISAYNRAGNIPFNEKSTSCITPLSVVPDSAPWNSGLTGKNIATNFLIKNDDVTLKSF